MEFQADWTSAFWLAVMPAVTVSNVLPSVSFAAKGRKFRSPKRSDTALAKPSSFCLHHFVGEGIFEA